MLTLPVDPGYAFDYAAIQEVKAVRFPTEPNVTNWQRTINSLVEQLGEDTLCGIIESPEYDALFDINSCVFDAVDKAKTDAITAREVDQLNYQRYQAKQALQRRFFDTEATEQKIGYS